MGDLHNLLVPTYRNMLQALSGWLSKAEDHGGDKLMSARLIDDMFPLAAQICFACLQAREPVYRLNGEPLPDALEALAATGRDGGAGLDNLTAAKDEVRKALAFLDTVTPEQLSGGEDQAVELVLPNGMTFDLSGLDYVRDWALPQFYFHLNTAYAILRKEGVPLGKVDYVPHMFAHMRK
ncbi:MAG: DUF1993 domain-containing protein [Pseudomonadota bacterium]